VNDKILVTGTRGGIGKYLHEQLGGTGFTRQSGNLSELKKRFFDVIIHCACNYTPPWLVTSENLDRYYYDNILLTQELLQIPHGYFVFFSTVDLYPLDDKCHLEGEVIGVNSLQSGIYSVTKLISELVVQSKAGNFLILRPTSLLGPYMRRNNLFKLFRDPYPVLFLAADSRYNLIRYSDVLEFIRLAVACKETGIFNLASSHTITLAEIADIVGKKASFGFHYYRTVGVANKKAVRILPLLKKAPEEVLREFLVENC